MKKQILIPLCTAIGVLVIGGSAFGIMKYKDSQTIIDVIPVSNISTFNWGNTNTTDGMITSNASQSIYLNSDQLIKEMYVSEGDTVSIGDKILEYDTTLTELDRESKQIDITKIDLQIKDLNKQIKNIKNGNFSDISGGFPDIGTALGKVPVERTMTTASGLNQMASSQLPPDTTAPETKTPDTVPLAHTPETQLDYSTELQTENGIFMVYCNSGSIIHPSFIYKIMGYDENGENRDEDKILYVILNIVDTNTTQPLNGAQLEKPEGDLQTTSVQEFIDNGLKFSKFDPDPTPDPDPDESESETLPDESESEILPDESESETLPDESESETLPDESESETDAESDFNPDFPVIDDGFGPDFGAPEAPSYTKDEINKMLSDKQLEIAKLQTSRKQADLDILKLDKTLKQSVVTSTVNGIVKIAGNPEEGAEEGQPFVLIESEEGLYLTGTISELQLGTVKPGQVVTLMSWMSGTSCEATITEIADYPANNGFGYSQNPNVSFYPFKAYIEDSTGLSNNEYVQVTMSPGSTDGNPDALYLYKAYVLEEEGHSYVYLRDENERLKKQEVTTGTMLYGSYVEITSGLSQADYIAFPYGKGLKDGVKTKEATDIYY